MRIRLSGADREKYDAPEWLEFDPDHIGLREAALLKRATKWSVERLSERLRGVEVWEDGQPVMKPVADDDGKPKLDEDGDPVMEPVREPDYEAMAVVVWMALRRAGKTLPWDDNFDVDMNGFDIEDDEEPEVGKAPTPETTS